MLSREFMNLKKRPKSNYFQVYQTEGDSVKRWIVYVIGPPRTLYEGGVFKTLIRFPDAYPMEPPSVQFLSNILHPNIYRDGKVCITTLQKPPPRSETNQSTLSSEVHWRPVLGVEQVYLSIISLLSDPNLDDPANAAAAAMMRDNLDDFKETVRAMRSVAKRCPL